MARTKRNLKPAAAAGPKERHKKSRRSQYNPRAPVPQGLVAKLPAPTKLKHRSYFEFVENTEKKKKLEVQDTTTKTPPPGFEFVPIGNPQLTTACKELSRERDAMIFTVSNVRDNDATHLSRQIHRIGHHVRQTIVEEARESIVDSPHHVVAALDGEPEPIPKSEAVYHAQVDAAIRDLFPRIPNTDRQMIIERTFTRSATQGAERPVGLCEEIPLARRVQLAVLAHIRHTHTRYDILLTETTWQNARKAVESLCLDTLVKWRGDEETGRDQLDEILREVVVISDSEDDSSDEEESTDDTSVEELGNDREASMPDYRSAQGSHRRNVEGRDSPRSSSRTIRPSTPTRSNSGSTGETDCDRRAEKRAHRGFRRYRAWEEAIRRNHAESAVPQHSSLNMAVNHRPYRQHGSAVVPHEMPNVLWNTSSRVSQPAPIGSSHEEVMSVAPDQHQSTLASRQPASPARFQDMLVRSIEPVSPNARPSFVRTLQPRSPDQMHPHPLRMRHHPGPEPTSHSGERTSIEHHTYNRSAIDNRASHKDSWRGVFPNEEPSQFPNFREANHSHSINRGISIASPLSYFTAGTRDHGFSQTRRIVINAPRPGERSNPILMEDRGGFYERINVRPEDAAKAQYQGAQPQRILEPHRVVSGEEGSRILRESQGTPGVEIIPISGPRARFSATRPNAASGPPSWAVPEIRAGGERHQGFREVLGSSSLSVPGGEYGALPPQGYWVVERHDNKPTAVEQYSERTNRQQWHTGPRNVIVLDD